jgi:hypothetical protein
MKENDFGYVIVDGKVKDAKVVTVSGCGRYFSAMYHVGGKMVKALLPVASFFASEFDARKEQRHELSETPQMG